MRPRGLLIIGLLLIALLAWLNPTEAEYRAHVTEREGIMGSVGLGLADLLSKGGNKSGVHRENYFVCSQFYIGGDGLLPRQTVAWGMAGKFWDTAKK